jgi:hypothetical protein
MTDDFGRLVLREGGGGGGRAARRRRGPPPRRPPFVAHPCTDWSESLVKEHLLACQTGRDPVTGEWDIDPDDPRECWAWLWETMPRTRPDGTLDWGAWSSVIREVEVP